MQRAPPAHCQLTATSYASLRQMPIKFQPIRWNNTRTVCLLDLYPPFPPRSSRQNKRFAPPPPPPPSFFSQQSWEPIPQSCHVSLVVNSCVGNWASTVFSSGSITRVPQGVSLRCVRLQLPSSSTSIATGCKQYNILASGSSDLKLFQMQALFPELNVHDLVCYF